MAQQQHHDDEQQQQLEAGGAGAADSQRHAAAAAAAAGNEQQQQPQQAAAAAPPPLAQRQQQEQQENCHQRNDGGGAGDEAHQQPQQQQQLAPPCFVIVYNLSKKHNVGTLLRSCTAFGVAAACLVGSRSYNTFGHHGAADHVPLRHYATLEECVDALRTQDGCRVLGVEIDPTARPVQAHAGLFAGPTAFMLGNEGQGLSPKQLRLCDGLVYIPQHGPGTASLNVTVAASIVLHHFATWARYPERAREGAKFDVAARPQRTAARGVVPPTPEQRAALAAARRGDGGGGGGAAGDDDDGDGEQWLLDAMCDALAAA